MTHLGINSSWKSRWRNVLLYLSYTLACYIYLALKRKIYLKNLWTSSTVLMPLYMFSNYFWQLSDGCCFNWSLKMWEVREADLAIVIEWMWNPTTPPLSVFAIFIDQFKWKTLENCAKDVKNVSEIYQEWYGICIWHLNTNSKKQNPPLHNICRRLQIRSKRLLKHFDKN